MDKAIEKDKGSLKLSKDAESAEMFFFTCPMMKRIPANHNRESTTVSYKKHPDLPLLASCPPVS